MTVYLSCLILDYYQIHNFHSSDSVDWQAEAYDAHSTLCPSFVTHAVD